MLRQDLLAVNQVSVDSPGCSKETGDVVGCAWHGVGLAALAGGSSQALRARNVGWVFGLPRFSEGEEEKVE